MRRTLVLASAALAGLLSRPKHAAAPASTKEKRGFTPPTFAVSRADGKRHPASVLRFAPTCVERPALDHLVAAGWRFEFLSQDVPPAKSGAALGFDADVMGISLRLGLGGFSVDQRARAPVLGAFPSFQLTIHLATQAGGSSRENAFCTSSESRNTALDRTYACAERLMGMAGKLPIESPDAVQRPPSPTSAR